MDENKKDKKGGFDDTDILREANRYELEELTDYELDVIINQVKTSQKGSGFIEPEKDTADKNSKNAAKNILDDIAERKENLRRIENKEIVEKEEQEQTAEMLRLEKLKAEQEKYIDTSEIKARAKKNKTGKINDVNAPLPRGNDTLSGSLRELLKSTANEALDVEEDDDYGDEQENSFAKFYDEIFDDTNSINTSNKIKSSRYSFDTHGDGATYKIKKSVSRIEREKNASSEKPFNIFFDYDNEKFLPVDEYNTDEAPEDFLLKLKKKNLSAAIRFFSILTVLFMTLMSRSGGAIYNLFANFNMYKNSSDSVVAGMASHIPMLLLLCVAAGLAYDILISGFRRLIKFKINWESMSFLLTATIVIYEIYRNISALAVNSIPSASFVLPAVFALMISLGVKIVRIETLRRNFKLIYGDKKCGAAVKIGNDSYVDSVLFDAMGESGEICGVAQPNKIENIVSNSFSSYLNERLSYVIIPVCVLIMVLFSIGHAVFAKETNIFTTICGALTVCTAAGIGLSSAMPLFFAAKKGERFRSAVIGSNSLNEFSDINGVMVNDKDVFPVRTVQLTGIKYLNDHRVDEVLEAVTAILTAADSCLAPAFINMFDKKMYSFSRVDNLEYDSENGVRAYYKKNLYLIGSRELMRAYDVWVPPDNYESRLDKSGAKALFISCNGLIVQVIGVKYFGSRSVISTLNKMYANDMHLFVATKNPHIKPEFIAEKQRHSELYTHILNKMTESKLKNKLKKSVDDDNTTSCGGIYSLSVLGMINGLCLCRRLKISILISTVLQFAAMLISILIFIIRMATTGDLGDLTVQLIVYNSLWMVLTIIISFII